MNAAADKAGEGKAPGGAALLLVDLVNDLVTEGAEALRENAETIGNAVEALRDAATRAGLPVIYVNDNFGHWRAHPEEIVRYCLRSGSHGRVLVERLRPRESDYFIVKPQFSGFYATNLSALLPRLGVNRLILAGIAADICVLFTAADAHMREYGLWVPRDAVASSSDRHRDWALGIMDKSMDAETRAIDELPLEEWLERR